VTGAAGSEDVSSPYRLPYSVSPRRYRLHLRPDLDAETFSGTVVIEADAHQPTEQVVLHCQELSVTAAAVTSGDRALDVEVRTDPDHDDRIVLGLGGRLEPGPLRIELSFSGKLLEQLRGLYRSTFTDADGRSRTLAVTQFEATDARRAFPCFDEPDRKAVFSLSVDVPEGMAAFSNTPVLSEEPLSGGGSRVQFADTIPMPSYLVALVVGRLDATEPVDVDGIPVRVVHVPGRGELTAFALEVAAHALRFFADWFGLPYPGAKLDLVAVPDFAFGAMENLGCVVFRETTLLVDARRAPRVDRERVADVVSHEIAHMWFGDLVTMKWWNGIWLNEAFASLMELLAVDAFRPEWERWVTFGVERDSAMSVDALHSTRPVEYPVGSPDEAQEMFDVLTYQKGAGVLRMLERYLPPGAFKEGIRRYLGEHQLRNTETTDLWDAIEQSSHEPVRRIMDSWILQGGFPEVRATRHGAALTLRQARFSYEDAVAGGGDRHWSIPVLVRSVGDDAVGDGALGDGALGETAGQGRHQRRLLEDEPVTLEVGDGPVVVNAGGWGFYRVSYDPAALSQLTPVVHRLETLERYNVLSDTWAALVAGRAGLGDFLRLAEALRRDPEPGVWRPVTGALDFLDHVVGDDVRALLAAYTRALVGPAFGAVGWERRPDEGERTSMLRGELLRLLGTVGADPEVRAECLARHAAAATGGPPLDPDLIPGILAVVARAGGRAEFDLFLQRYHDPATPQEAIRYLQGLAGFEDVSLAGRAFDVATTEARSQDGPFVIYFLLANRVAGAATWDRLEASWDDVRARFPANIFPRMLEGIRLMCRNAAQVERVRAFLASHPVPGGQRGVDQSLERLGVNLALATRMAASLADELRAGAGRLSGT
jgi:puromycin-sensitive aminopeptidase